MGADALRDRERGALAHRPAGRARRRASTRRGPAPARAARARRSRVACLLSRGPVRRGRVLASHPPLERVRRGGEHPRAPIAGANSLRTRAQLCARSRVHAADRRARPHAIDTMAANSDRVVEETLAVLQTLAADGPTDEELDDERRFADRALTEPTEIPAQLFYGRRSTCSGPSSSSRRSSCDSEKSSVGKRSPPRSPRRSRRCS